MAELRAKNCRKMVKKRDFWLSFVSQLEQGLGPPQGLGHSGQGLGPPQGLGHSGQELGPPAGVRSLGQELGTLAGVRSLVARVRAPRRG